MADWVPTGADLVVDTAANLVWNVMAIGSADLLADAIWNVTADLVWNVMALLIRYRAADLVWNIMAVLSRNVRANLVIGITANLVRNVLADLMRFGVAVGWVRNVTANLVVFAVAVLAWNIVADLMIRANATSDGLANLMPLSIGSANLVRHVLTSRFVRALLVRGRRTNLRRLV